MSLRTVENEMFDRWLKHRNGFVKDGLVNEDAYISSKKKILYLLKEVNDSNGGGWDLRDYVKSGARASTWNNITRWTIGLQNIDSDISWNEIEHIDAEQRQVTLQSICAVNLKKTPGGSVCNTEELNRIAEEDKDYLNQQIQLYDPDILICCGTSDEYHKIHENEDEWKMTSQGIWYYERMSNKYVLAFVHPEARIKSNFTYYMLINAVKEIMSDNRVL